MPIFEYKCSECNTKFDFLHKSTTKIEDVHCPTCDSIKNQKLFSAFSSSINSDVHKSYGNCSTGNCRIEESGCTSGRCGMN
jgi:putative FmdB family regulatory protein